jgi:hypothetical protein
MRCYCCDKNLNDYESVARHAITGAFTDLCRKCIQETNTPVVSNPEYNPFDSVDDSDTDNFTPVPLFNFEEEE